jgi:sugar O-acyltransferase (sialic acid O-acetyltransferase NeuD family)
MKEKIIVYGASGHGKVVVDILEKNQVEVLGFIDDNRDLWGKSFFGYSVLGGKECLLGMRDREKFLVIIAIGDNRIREKIQKILKKENIEFGKALHPSAQLGRETSVGEGTVVMANSVINPGTRIGKHCIINTSATVDHDCVIGDFAHLSPGAHLGGHVQVGPFAWIGLGASIINNVEVGEHAIVGAGSVVINNVDANTVVKGIPAAFLKNKSGD